MRLSLAWTSLLAFTMPAMSLKPHPYDMLPAKYNDTIWAKELARNKAKDPRYNGGANLTGELATRSIPETDYIAFVAWCGEPDCPVGPESEHKRAFYYAQDLTHFSYDPDQCDPGNPPAHNDTTHELYKVPFAVQSFYVLEGVSACEHTQDGTQNYLGSVSLYNNCKRKLSGVEKDDPSFYCQCDEEKWSIDNGYGGTINTPKFAHSVPRAYAIDPQRVSFCNSHG